MEQPPPIDCGSEVAPKAEPSSFDRAVTYAIEAAEQEHIQKHVADCLFDKERRRVEAKMTRLQHLTVCRTFEWVSGILIVLNAVLLGLETHWEAERTWRARLNGTALAAEDSSSLDLLAVLFSVAFTVELVLRWAAEGFLGFFRTTDAGWNVFDFIIISVGVADHVLRLLGVRLPTNVSVLRVLRVVRVVRVARIIRVMRFYRELRIMIYSILGCFKSLLWIALIFGMIFYLVGVALTMGITTYLQSDARVPASELKVLHSQFGTLDRSMLSLYMAMSGGNDWSAYYDVLGDLPLYQALFLAYITFAVFAAVNIVTGVFVDAAMQSTQADKEVIISEELENKKEYLVEMGKLFAAMDQDRTGWITREEFEALLSDERVVAYFRALQLDVPSAHVLFRLLDRNESGCIEQREFLHGCWRLQGGASAFDSAVMEHDMRSLKRAILQIHRDVSSLLAARPPASAEVSAAPDPAHTAVKAPSRPRHRLRPAGQSPLRALAKTADDAADGGVLAGDLLPNPPGGA